MGTLAKLCTFKVQVHVRGSEQAMVQGNSCVWKHCQTVRFQAVHIIRELREKVTVKLLLQGSRCGNTCRTHSISKCRLMWVVVNPPARCWAVGAGSVKAVLGCSTFALVGFGKACQAVQCRNCRPK
jgi:hypothetical protein